MKFFVSISLCFISIQCFAQNHLFGFVADSLTKKPLPFATVRAGNKQNAVLSGIDGRYAITLHSDVGHIIVSYVGYTSKNIPVDLLKNNDTIFLVRSPS